VCLPDTFNSVDRSASAASTEPAEGAVWATVDSRSPSTTAAPTWHSDCPPYFSVGSVKSLCFQALSGKPVRLSVLEDQDSGNYLHTSRSSFCAACPRRLRWTKGHKVESDRPEETERQ
jgi:hypothetical protein